MATPTLEERVAALECQLATLAKVLDSHQGSIDGAIAFMETASALADPKGSAQPENLNQLSENGPSS